MNRREILNELQQIVAITDTVGSDYGIPEASRRAKGLIQVIESWPTAFPPAPFVSNQCCERHHGECQLGSANQPFSRLCNCACHCPPEAPQQPTQPDPPAARHIDTPDELLELLAGVSSDPQIEGLSLAQKASTIALLHIAKALQEGVKAQHDAMAYLMDKTAASIAPQPIRIFSKHSRRRHALRSAVYDAAAANDLARRIVNRADTEATCEGKTVDIALMIREAFREWVEPPQPPKPDDDNLPEPI
jgi:hypothetical protein